VAGDYIRNRKFVAVELSSDVFVVVTRKMGEFGREMNASFWERRQIFRFIALSKWRLRLHCVTCYLCVRKAARRNFGCGG